MSRRRRSAKREILADPKYHSELVAKFVNVVMKSGKKSIAQGIIYAAFELVLQKVNKSSAPEGTDSAVAEERMVKLFDAILDKVRPSVEVRSRRIGGATYQIPVEIPLSRRTTLAMRWIIEAAKKRSEKGMVKRLAGELLDILEGRGYAIKKLEDTIKMAKANQAFAHLRIS